MMLILSILFFIVAAILGIVMITYILLDKNVPKGFVLIHGPFALIGLILLIVHGFSHFNGLYVAITLFIIAALLGPIVFYRDITGRNKLKGLASLHGIIAIIAFIFVVMFAIFH